MFEQQERHVEIAYSNRVVAFLDILGMRQHLATGNAGTEFVDSIVRILQAVIRPANGDNILPHVSRPGGVDSLIGGWVHQFKGCQITSMSDSIVISYPEKLKFGKWFTGRIFSVYACMEDVFSIQRALLQLGVLIRGAISIGKLYHKAPYVVGDGLVSAYELESQVAIYPRVILDARIIEILLNDPLPDIPFAESRIGSLFRKDRDGLYFVDYLGFNGMGVETDWHERARTIIDFVEDQVGEITSPRIKQKWLWLSEYLRQARALWDDKDFETRPHDTDGPLESRYPRNYRESRTYGDMKRARIIDDDGNILKSD